MMKAVILEEIAVATNQDALGVEFSKRYIDTVRTDALSGRIKQELIRARSYESLRAPLMGDCPPGRRGHVIQLPVRCSVRRKFSWPRLINLGVFISKVGVQRRGAGRFHRLRINDNFRPQPTLRSIFLPQTPLASGWIP